MSNKIHLAWAVPVNPTLTAASLMAYASTKATITTFRLCARYAYQRSEPLGLLVPKILLSIEDYVVSERYAEEFQEWAPRLECLSHDCDLQRHWTKEEYDELRKDALEDFEPMDLDLDNNSESRDEEFEEFFDGYRYERSDKLRDRHLDVAEHLLDYLTTSDSRWAKSKAFFAKNEGLEVHFDVFPEYTDEWEGDPTLLTARVTAFLMLPRCEYAMENLPGPNQGGFSIANRINPLDFRPLCNSEKSLFDMSLRILKLKATEEYLHQDVFVSDTGKKADVLGYRGLESRGRQAQDTQLVESKERWPALMFLGSGSLKAFASDTA